MPRRPNPVPTYRLHTASGQAVVTLAGPCGARRDVYLGPYGSEASKAEYERVLSEWRASGGRLPSPAPDLTVNELVLAFWKFAESYYRGPDGKPSGGLDDYKHALRPLRKLYGHTAAAQFGPRALKAIQEHLVNSGLCRRQVNARVMKVRRVFKWGVAEELIPAAVYHGLAAVEGLKIGRSAARETAPVRPVAAELVDAALKHVRPPVAAMIRLQTLTGMRPGEVVIMRGCDLDRGGAVWKYQPHKHKNDWRGKDRVVFLGPQAQAVLTSFLTGDPAAYLFSPAEDAPAIAAEKRSRRATPLYPSHVRHQQKKRKKVRRRAPRDRYTTRSYARAIARACEAARISAWSPNRLRHTHGTAVRKLFGIEAARVLLGHSRLQTTEIYSERDMAAAERIAAAVG